MWLAAHLRGVTLCLDQGLGAEAILHTPLLETQALQGVMGHLGPTKTLN